MTFAYYNEFDPAAAEWLRWLIAEGHIPNGWVDERSIVDVQPDDLAGYTQVHFFAGIGGWAYAARLAGWPDDRPIWTGSCPCQPFSVAGKGAGVNDVRHLWPDFFRLISACRPAVVVGEQVAGKAGYGWFDGVATDMEGGGYACRAVDIPACAVDAPHIRSRLYWVAVAMADANSAGSLSAAHTGIHRQAQGERSRDVEPERHDGADCARHMGNAARCRQPIGGLGVCEGREGSVSHRPNAPADTLADSQRHGGRPEPEFRGGRPAASGTDSSGELGDSAIKRCSQALGEPGDGGAADQQGPANCLERAHGAHGVNGTFWSDHEWLVCHDGKARRTFTGLFGLAYGLSSGMVGLLPRYFVAAKEEVDRYGQAQNRNADEVLREVLRAVRAPQPITPASEQRQTGAGLGVPEGVLPPQVLFAFLCELDRRYYRSGGVFAVDKAAGKPVRSVRGTSEPALPSCEREHLSERSEQLANSVRELPHILARYASEAWEALKQPDAKNMGLLTNGFPGRVAAWRGFGNAIVPQLAAEVIKALMETEA